MASAEDYLDFLRTMASGVEQDIGGGYAGMGAGIGQLARGQGRQAALDAAAEAVRRVQSRTYVTPGSQRVAEQLSNLGTKINKGYQDYVPASIRSELAAPVQGAEHAWERTTTATPGLAALTAGVVGAGIPETEEAEAPLRAVRQSVLRPLRKDLPGIYKDPRQIASEAEARVGPEDPLMQRLFGVSRQDLSDIGARSGNIPGAFPGMTANPRGSAAASQVMTTPNARRLTNILEATQERAPGLTAGMKGWYVMDPVYQQLESMFGPDEARQRYTQLNAAMATHSPRSPVDKEITRGTAANMLATQGRYEDWLRAGGLPAGSKGVPDIEQVPGHMAHSTAQAPAFGKFLSGGTIASDEPKVPLYVQASGVPQTGFQTNFPVPDVHFASGLGLPDVRTSKAPMGPLSGPEAQAIGPWYREQVARQAGLEAVPAQAIQWGALGPQTGVMTDLGVPKLELLSRQIGKAANRLGVSPETARDMVLSGKTYAGQADPALLGYIAAGGAGAAAGAAAAGDNGN